MKSGEGDAILDRLNNVRQILVAAIDVDEASDQEGYLTDCQISLHNTGRNIEFVKNLHACKTLCKSND